MSEGKRPYLTVGMATYDDFHGVWATIMSMRLNHPELMPRMEFVIVDNNPSEDGNSHSASIRAMLMHVPNARYVAFGDFKSTSVRNKIFEHARGEWVMSVDCHVLFEHPTIPRLIRFLEDHNDSLDFYQGPLLYDDLGTISTHFENVWRDEMFGIWATNETHKHVDAEPFEIPSQGLGCFLCKKEAWLGFNPFFRGFGGEEGYIHEKFRKAGRKCWCLPFFRWNHRFYRPGGVPYPLSVADKIHNYFLGWYELGWPEEQIIEHFTKRTTADKLVQLQKQAHDEWDNAQNQQVQETVQAAPNVSEMLTKDSLQVAAQLAQKLIIMEQPRRDAYLSRLRELQPSLFKLVRADLQDMLERKGAA